MIIRKSCGKLPEISHSARGAENAAVIGEVTLSCGEMRAPYTSATDPTFRTTALYTVLPGCLYRWAGM